MKICVLENAIWFNGCFMSKATYTALCSLVGKYYYASGLLLCVDAITDRWTLYYLT